MRWACPEGWRSTRVAGLQTCEPGSEWPNATTRCPEGWRLDGPPAPRCDPFPGPEETTCPDARVRLPGQSLCGPVGSPCPVGRFSERIIEGPVVFVASRDEPSTPFGDGTSPERPLAGLQGLDLGSLEEGTTLSLGRGRFDLVVGAALADDLSWVGACASETELIVQAAGADGALRVRSAHSAFRDLSIRGALRFEGGRVELEGVSIRGGTGPVLSVRDRAWVEVDTVIVSQGPSPTSSTPLVVVEDGELDATGLSVATEGGGGILVTGPTSRLLLHRSVLRGPEIPGGSPVWGGTVLDGAQAEISESAVVGFSEGGIVAREATTELTQVAFQRSSSGFGVVASQGATVALQAGWLEHVGPFALAAEGEGSRILVSETSVRVSGSGDFGNRGVARVEGGARLEARQVDVDFQEEVGADGLDLVGPGSVADLSDVRIRGARVGLVAWLGARADATRLVIDDVRDIGLIAAERDTTIISEHLRVGRSPAAVVTDEQVPLVSAGFGAELSLRFADLRLGRDRGLEVDSDASAVLEDVRLVETSESGARAVLLVLDGARVDGRGVGVVAPAEFIGIALRQGSEATLEGVEVRPSTDGAMERAIVLQEGSAASLRFASVRGGIDVRSSALEAVDFVHLLESEANIDVRAESSIVLSRFQLRRRSSSPSVWLDRSEGSFIDGLISEPSIAEVGGEPFLVTNRSQTSLRRLSAVMAGSGGILAEAGGLTARDVRVDSARSALELRPGTRAELERFSASGTRGIGIRAISATLHLADTAVIDTEIADCYSQGTCAVGGGVGIEIERPGDGSTLRNLRVERAGGCGLLLTAAPIQTSAVGISRSRVALCARRMTEGDVGQVLLSLSTRANDRVIEVEF